MKAKVEAWSAAGVIGCFGASAWMWDRVPDRVPVHWDITGAVDRYGSRAEGLLVLPTVALGLWILLAAVPRLDRTGNLARSQSAYDGIRTASVLFLVVIHLALLSAAAGGAVDIGRVVGIAVGLLFAATGNAMGKLRPNAFAGIRTPWTLTSLRSWNQTHRLAGWLFTVHGLCTAAVALVWPPLGVGLLVVGALANVAVCTGWSWWAWRGDPDKVPFGGVVPADEPAEPSPDAPRP